MRKELGRELGTNVFNPLWFVATVVMCQLCLDERWTPVMTTRHSSFVPHIHGWSQPRNQIFYTQILLAYFLINRNSFLLLGGTWSVSKFQLWMTKEWQKSACGGLIVCSDWSFFMDLVGEHQENMSTRGFLSWEMVETWRDASWGETNDAEWWV